MLRQCGLGGTNDKQPSVHIVVYWGENNQVFNEVYIINITREIPFYFGLSSFWKNERQGFDLMTV